MKTILIYGDSNVYGYNPLNGGRYDVLTRWSGILSDTLKDEYHVLEQGMNNRTGFFKNPEGLKYSGGDYLSIYLQNHKNIDICILALGTNDAQRFYDLEENSCEIGLLNLINSVLEANSKTQIIIIPPVKITDKILNSGFSFMFNSQSIEKIDKVFSIFEKVAQQNNCLYFDLNKVVQPSEIDGLHYTEEAHAIIARNLITVIKEFTI